VAARTSRTVALMAMHPQFARLILDGKKKVEFRKTRLTVEVSHILIYATVPIQGIIGFFEVHRIQEGVPDDLWDIYQDVAGIEEKVFRKYYGSASRGIAIEVGRVFALSRPVQLKQIAGKRKASAPQSFRYVNAKAFDHIEDCCGSSRSTRRRSRLTCCTTCSLRIVRTLARSSSGPCVGARRENGNGA
jgi:predicted transcriptional regulator